jgi:hypothetical protein
MFQPTSKTEDGGLKERHFLFFFLKILSVYLGSTRLFLKLRFPGDVSFFLSKHCEALIKHWIIFNPCILDISNHLLDQFLTMFFIEGMKHRPENLISRNMGVDLTDNNEPNERLNGFFVCFFYKK